MATLSNEKVAAFTREVIRVNTAFRQYLQARLRASGLDLTFEMLQVLGCLWQTDGVNQQEIANLTVKDKASVTYLIDNLTRRNLVYRKEDEADRRNKQIYLTEEGRALKCRLEPWLHEMHSFAGGDVSATALDECMSVLAKFRENLAKETNG